MTSIRKDFDRLLHVIPDENSPEAIQQFSIPFGLTTKTFRVDRSYCKKVISKGGIRDLDSHEASNVELEECTAFGNSNKSKQKINNTDIDFRMFKMVFPGDEAEEGEVAEASDLLSCGFAKS